MEPNMNQPNCPLCHGSKKLYVGLPAMGGSLIAGDPDPRSDPNAGIEDCLCEGDVDGYVMQLIRFIRNMRQPEDDHTMSSEFPVLKPEEVTESDPPEIFACQLCGCMLPRDELDSCTHGANFLGMLDT